MNPSRKFSHTTTLLLTSLLAGASLLGAADDSSTTSNSATVAVTGQSQNDEIAHLKATLAEQQKQLQLLQQTLQNQQALLEKALGSQATGGGNSGSVRRYVHRHWPGGIDWPDNPGGAYPGNRI